MKTIDSSKNTWLTVTVFIAGLSLLYASSKMAQYIDLAPIPNALERWGQDGYSFFHEFILLMGVGLILVISAIIEVFTLCWLEKGFKLGRWFSIFSIILFVFGCLAVWECWDIWIEARNDYSLRGAIHECVG